MDSSMLRNMAGDLNAYLDNVRIESDAGPVAFTPDPWHRADIDGITPAVVKLVVTNAPEPDRRRAWWVRPRGHSKTADFALLLCWVLAFSRRRRRCVWVAADQDQGLEGLDAVGTLCRHNPWLDHLLTTRADRVENSRTGSVCYFTTSDVGSAFGWKDCDLFVLDEVTHWSRTQGENLWGAMYSAVGKRKNAVVFVGMNAGHLDTWQHRLRGVAEADPNWCFSELGGPLASWITSEALADQRKYLPSGVFNRLWENQWTHGIGDAIDVAEIESAVTLPGPTSDRQLGYYYRAGLDLGLKHDHAALVILGCHAGHTEAVEEGKRRPATRMERILGDVTPDMLRDTQTGERMRPQDIDWDAFLRRPRKTAFRGVAGTGKYRLACVRVWRPSGKQAIVLDQVEKEVLELHRTFKFSLLADEWQAAQLLQRIGRRGVRCQGVNFSGSTLQEMAVKLLGIFRDGKVELFDHPQLIRDLQRLTIVEKSYGYRLESPRVKGEGHGDAASAFALALLAFTRLKRRQGVRSIPHLEQYLHAQ